MRSLSLWRNWLRVCCALGSGLESRSETLMFFFVCCVCFHLPYTSTQWLESNENESFLTHRATECVFPQRRNDNDGIASASSWCSSFFAGDLPKMRSTSTSKVGGRGGGIRLTPEVLARALTQAQQRLTCTKNSTIFQHSPYYFSFFLHVDMETLSLS